jgi:hypothetical protein
VNSAARVPVRGINFGHRTLSAAGGEDGPGATVPAGYHSHRGDLDVRRVEDFLFHTRSATWIRPANLLSFFLPVFIDVPEQVGSNAACRRFIFARLIRFRATSILPDVSAEFNRSSLIEGFNRLWLCLMPAGSGTFFGKRRQKRPRRSRLSRFSKVIVSNSTIQCYSFDSTIHACDNSRSSLGSRYEGAGSDSEPDAELESLETINVRSAPRESIENAFLAAGSLGR